MERMNLEEVTVQDCLDMYEKKGKVSIIKDGRLIGFYEEKNENLY